MEQTTSGAVAELVRMHGYEALDEPRRFEQLLRARVPESRRESAALLSALRIRIPARLSKLPPNSKVSESLASNYAARLREERAVDAESARWAVAAWANAFGLSMPSGGNAVLPVASLPMNPAAWQELRKIVSKYQQELTTEGGDRLCEGLLRDRCPNSKREIAVLVTILREGIPGELFCARTDAKPPGLSQFVDRMVKEHAIDQDAATWGVASWADALGLSVSQFVEIKKPPKVEQPPTIKQPPERKEPSDIKAPEERKSTFLPAKMAGFGFLGALLAGALYIYTFSQRLEPQLYISMRSGIFALAVTAGAWLFYNKSARFMTWFAAIIAVPYFVATNVGSFLSSSIMPPTLPAVTLFPGTIFRTNAFIFGRSIIYQLLVALCILAATSWRFPSFRSVAVWCCTLGVGVFVGSLATFGYGARDAGIVFIFFTVIPWTLFAACIGFGLSRRSTPW
jgi:hypothetical protein